MLWDIVRVLFFRGGELGVEISTHTLNRYICTHGDARTTTLHSYTTTHTQHHARSQGVPWCCVYSTRFEAVTFVCVVPCDLQGRRPCAATDMTMQANSVTTTIMCGMMVAAVASWTHFACVRAHDCIRAPLVVLGTWCTRPFVCVWSCLMRVCCSRSLQFSLLQCVHVERSRHR